MYSIKSYELTQSEYNYLLASLSKKLSYHNGKYYFVGNSEYLSYMLDCLKGLYDYYDDLGSMITYKCFINGNLGVFRDYINNKTVSRETLN